MRSVIFLLVVSGFSVPSSTIAQDFVLTLTELTAEVGDCRTVSIQLENNSDGEVEGYEFSICYPADLLSLDESEVQSVSGLKFDGDVVSVEGGELTISASLEDTADPIGAGELVELYRVRFHAVAEGVDELSLCVGTSSTVLTESGKEDLEILSSAVETVPADDVPNPDYEFSISSASGVVDDVVLTVTLRNDSEEDVKAVQFGVCHDPDVLEIGDVIDGVDLPELSVTTLFVDSEGWSMTAFFGPSPSGVLDDGDYELFEVEYLVLADDNATTAVHFCGGGGGLPVDKPIVLADGSPIATGAAGTVSIGGGGSLPDLPDPFVWADDYIGSVSSITTTTGGFEPGTDDISFFGMSLSVIGDVDDDGVLDVAVYGLRDEEDGVVWLLFLEDDGSVREQVELLSASTADPRAPRFGISGIGDFDSNGVPDVAVSRDGVVTLMLLDENGDVLETNETTVSAEVGESFGLSIACIGDVDDDGVVDLLVGEPGRDDNTGSVWVLFLDEEGDVVDEQEISDSTGGFGGSLADAIWFGDAVAALGDVDGDSIPDVAVHALHLDGNNVWGEVWVLFLEEDGTVASESYLRGDDPVFEGTTRTHDALGSGICSPGDLNADGVPDLVVGAPGDDDGGLNTGGIWFVYLDDAGSALGASKFSDTTCALELDLDNYDHFGFSTATGGDFDGDGVCDVLVGAPFEEAVGGGAVHLVTLDIPLEEPTVGAFKRGDVDGNDEVFAILDAIYLLEWSFTDGSEPPCETAADVDDSGEIFGLIDALFLLQWAFIDGDEPPAPGVRECGVDPTVDLDCDTESACL